MNQKKTYSYIEQIWQQSIIPTLSKYITIPNKSVAFDKEWEKHGYMEQALELVKTWCLQQPVANMQLKIQRIPNKTPVLFIDIPGAIDETVLLYGHLDKQPEMSGWASDLGPWKPVLKDDRLYGRGAADDGYAVFSALTAISALQQEGIAHARCIILIECSEESGSPDLPFYVEQLKDQIGKPSLIICLDSGCGNYDQLWCTTSLRGVINGILKIKILTEGVHSGSAGGIVPSTFKILRELLNRIENQTTGEITLSALQVEIPESRYKQAQQVAQTLQNQVWNEFPFVPNGKPISENLLELVLNRTWRAALEITGISGIPALENAGNVLRPELEVMLSMRIPPTCDAETAAKQLKETLEKNPPYHAEISFSPHDRGTGWNSAPMASWLETALNDASKNFFNAPALQWGEGGSIPFTGMLGKRFPQAQFVITGVLGPKSNAHGPNEFLHIPTAKKLTACIAFILEKHYEKFSK